jgi:hypothetical protein
MALPIECCTQKVIYRAHPFNRNSASGKSGLEMVFLHRIFREEEKIVNVDSNMDLLPGGGMRGGEIGRLPRLRKGTGRVVMA